MHLNISSPGLAKHAWSCFFAPWIAEATIFIYNYARSDAAAHLGQLRERGVDSFCAAPTVWRMLMKVHLGERPGAAGGLFNSATPRNYPLNTNTALCVNTALAYSFFVGPDRVPAGQV